MKYLPPLTGGSLPIDTVNHVDMFDLMAALPDNSIDMIFADLPYNTTACAWEWEVPLDQWWNMAYRVAKPNAAIVMTASQPFTAQLVMSNVKGFRHEWIWEKSLATGHLNARRAPMKAHESIIVFSEKSAFYKPKFEQGNPYKKLSGGACEYIRDKTLGAYISTNKGIRFPRSVLRFPNADHTNALHPTQKPVSLVEYMIRTYTNADSIVLDPVCGSGTTAIAARNTGRRFIVGDLELKYVEAARKRLAQPYTLPMFNEETA